MLQTWSIVTGDLLFNSFAEDFTRFKNYMVYQADSKDLSHLRDFGQQDKKAISLVYRSTPTTLSEKIGIHYKKKVLSDEAKAALE